MNQSGPISSGARELFPWERRKSVRYRLPVPLTVEARAQGRTVLLERVPAPENISAGGVCFCLSINGAAALPADAELEISFPLVDRLFHPARLYARCQARLVWRQGANRVGAEFEQVEFVREEQLSGLPIPMNA